MLTPKKRLGQHFLNDQNIALKIVNSLAAEPDEPVVEIGPGTGALTSLLAERYRWFSVIEVDPRAAGVLREKHPLLKIFVGDVLTFDWERLYLEYGKKLSVIGNLPYNITSQILFSLFDSPACIGEVVVMMQYEVAQRLVAVPRTKAYGILSVATQLLCTPQILFPVSRNVFYPKPDVRSAVVRLTFSEEPRAQTGSDPKWVRNVIRTAFNQRRKTLRNSLKSLCEAHSTALPDAYSDKRAEELSPDDFVKLARYLQADS